MICSFVFDVVITIFASNGFSQNESIAMTKKNTIQLFENKKVRTVWDEEREKWYFSIVDVIEVLTDSPNPRKYWSVLKKPS